MINMNPDDKKILEEIHTIKNHSHNTKNVYRTAVNTYTTFQEMTLTELLEEAEEEEEKGIRWKHRTLKKRLNSYRAYLINHYRPNTVKSNLNPIINIYKYHEIEIQALPRILQKSYPHTTPLITYEDLPDKDIIRKALEISTPVMKAIILFMSSSGCARTETLNLTIQDYMKATTDYHQGGTIYEIIETLNQIEDVIPTWQIHRQKTGKNYTTFSSPESVNQINNYLQTRPHLTPEYPLFQINKNYFIMKFVETNNTLGLGKIDGGLNRFRSHMLRKYHASTLYNDGMSLENVNDLQGKSKNQTDASYFYVNSDDLKIEYMKHLSALQISVDVKKVTVKSKEFLELENQNRDLQNQMDSIFKKLDQLENLSWNDIKK